MAEREAVVIILDVGPTVCSPSASSSIKTEQGPSSSSSIKSDQGPSTSSIKSEGPSTTFLDESLKCTSMILQRKIFSESKDEVALVLCGTADTDNPLASASKPDEYRHISVAREMGVVSWSFMEMTMQIKPGGASADVIDALVVAVDHLHRTTENRPARSKFTGRQIYCMSDFRGKFSTDQVDTIVSCLRNMNVQLNVIGPDLRPKLATNLAESKMKVESPRNSVEVINQIIEKTDGASYTFSDLILALRVFKRKSVRPTPWKVDLEIGPRLSIPVCCYIKVKREPAKSWKKVYKLDPSAKVVTETSYHLMDDLQVAIDKKDTIEAYRYGRTLVPFSAEDRANMDYKSGGKNFAILGFTKESNIKRHEFIGDSVHYVIANPASEFGVKALSAIIHALHELDMVGIVRHVYSKASSPKIGFLAPRIKADYECLVFIQLPFAEDLRKFTLPSLDANPKNIPTEEQLAAIDELIDCMDLSGPPEKFKPKLMCNPYIERLNQCLLHRGLNPGAPLPEIDPEILRAFSPDPEMLKACEPIAEKLKQLFPLKKVVKDKTTTENLFKDPAEVKMEVGGEDAENVEESNAVKKRRLDEFVGVAEFVKVAVTEVGTVNPVDDFLEIIRNNRADFDDACRQMTKVIVQLVMDSFSELQCQENYKKALASLEVMRRESIETPQSTSAFNEFLRNFKVALLAKDKREFWEKIRTSEKGLITTEESPQSTDACTVDAALKFLAADDDAKVDTQPEVQDQNEDVDDLLDMM